MQAADESLHGALASCIDKRRHSSRQTSDAVFRCRSYEWTLLLQISDFSRKFGAFVISLFSRICDITILQNFSVGLSYAE